MYIRIVNTKNEYYGQYFEVSNTQNNYICHINEYSFAFHYFSCEKVTLNQEKKRAFWKFRRFKNTFLMHKELNQYLNTTLLIDKFGTPNINFTINESKFSICYFNDTDRWGIFKDGEQWKIFSVLNGYSHMQSKERVIQWIQNLIS